MKIVSIGALKRSGRMEGENIVKQWFCYRTAGCIIVTSQGVAGWENMNKI